MAEHIARQIHTLLLKRGLTVSVAESCTGGLISKLLTDLPGSSGYFILGITTYSNAAKNAILKIPLALIRKEGAVSEAVAIRMACQARALGKTSFGVGITGIAGPQGGSASKPVGTVFICVSTKKKTVCRKFHFSGSRKTVRERSSIAALRLLYEAAS